MFVFSDKSSAIMILIKLMCNNNKQALRVRASTILYHLLSHPGVGAGGQGVGNLRPEIQKCFLSL